MNKTIYITLFLLIISSLSVFAVCIGTGITPNITACSEPEGESLSVESVTDKTDFSVEMACSNNGAEPYAMSVEVTNLDSGEVIGFGAVYDISSDEPYNVTEVSSKDLDVGDTLQIDYTCYWNPSATLTEYVTVESSVKKNTPKENEELLWFYYEPTDTNISIEFLNMNNISGQVLPIQSPIGLKTQLDSLTQNQDKWKWSYELFLPSPQWVAVNRIRTNQGVYDIGETYGFQVGAIGTIDYTDAVLEGFNVSVVVNDGIQNISGNLTYNASLNYADVIMWKDYQGASKVTIDPEICIPDWKPATFTDCQTDNSKLALSYIDENNCGLEYNGTYYEYYCDYCTPDWYCSLFNESCLNNNYECEEITDTNGCYALTGLGSDLYLGNQNLDDFNAGYCNTYESEDLGNIVIDFLGKYGVQLGSVASLIAIFGLFLWLRKKRINK